MTDKPGTQEVPGFFVFRDGDGKDGLCAQSVGRLSEAREGPLGEGEATKEEGRIDDGAKQHGMEKRNRRDVAGDQPHDVLGVERPKRPDAEVRHNKEEHGAGDRSGRHRHYTLPRPEHKAQTRRQHNAAVDERQKMVGPDYQIT